MPRSVTRTMRLKVRSESYPWLQGAATEVNQVFNYCNEISICTARRTDRGRKWLSGFDLCNLTAGSSEYFEHIGADTIQRICTEYSAKRAAVRRAKLRWRVSGGARRALGWVPFKAANLKRQGRSVRFCGKSFRVFESERLERVKWKQGCFAEDAVGDWYLCLPIDVQVEDRAAKEEAVGIDLGLKAVAVTSEGERLEAGRFYRDLEGRIAQAQRRGHRRQAKRLHRKAARCRADALHKFSGQMVQRYQNIYVGDVSSPQLVKTRIAKSVLDSGWGMLRHFLQYKGEHAGRSVIIVNESYTTRTCSGCGALTGPAGPDMLAVRSWSCDYCGEWHERDVNAARNILLFGSRCRTSVSGNEPSSSAPPSQASGRCEAGNSAPRRTA